jgi:phage shock protein PspC (stress-responsive transcriptional regulator)
MVAGWSPGHDGGMNAEDTRTTPPPDEFQAQRLRTITDMKRSKDDRLLGGVCSGAAKYLNIDPVIVRVVLAVLTIVGFAGVIIYAAAWFLLPAEGEERSIAAEWFKLDKNEEQVRVAGLVGAVVLAALAVVNNNGLFWDGAPWILVPIAFVFYLFVVRPRRRRDTQAALAAQHAPPGVAPADGSVRGPELAAAEAALVGPGTVEKPRRERSWTLTWLTLSVAAIAVAATGIYSEYHDAAPWTTYVAVTLAVVAVGLLVSTLFGHGGPLIGIGVLLAVALAIGSLMPNGRLGEQKPVPTAAADVDAHYEHGVGLLELDLTEVADPTGLLGRTVELESAAGQIKVIVPTGLNVEVDSRLGAGEIAVFNRTENGTDNRLDYPAPATGPALTLDIHQRLGNIEVIRR